LIYKDIEIVEATPIREASTILTLKTELAALRAVVVKAEKQ